MAKKPIEYILIEHFHPDEEAMRSAIEHTIIDTAKNRAKKLRELEKRHSQCEASAGTTSDPGERGEKKDV